MAASNEVRNLLAEPAAHHGRKAFTLRTRELMTHHTLQYCVSLTVIFCASQLWALQTSLNVILLVFFLWCLPKMYDAGWEQGKRETTPLLKSLKIPKALQDIGWCYPCVFVWGWLFFSEEAGKLIRLYWSNNEDLNLLPLLFMSKQTKDGWTWSHWGTSHIHLVSFTAADIS